jgi:hypothetical protein
MNSRPEVVCPGLMVRSTDDRAAGGQNVAAARALDLDREGGGDVAPVELGRIDRSAIGAT